MSVLVNLRYVSVFPVFGNLVLLMRQIVNVDERLKDLLLEFLEQPERHGVRSGGLVCLRFIKVNLQLPFVNCADF